MKFCTEYGFLLSVLITHFVMNCTHRTVIYEHCCRLVYDNIYQCVRVLYHRFCAMDPSILAAMDKEALKKQIENMKYQASMERWPLSKSIAA